MHGRLEPVFLCHKHGIVAPIPVLVSDTHGITTYTVPDPGTNPELWPWTWLEDLDG